MRKQEDLIMNINKLRNSLVNSELSIAAVARKTKLSRTALHNFINGGSVRESTAKKIDIVLHNLNEDIRLLGGHNMEASKIIDLQDKTIMYQEKEIKYLKKVINKKQAESTHWEALEYDFTCNVTLVRKGLRFGRIIESVTDLDRQAQTLGYQLEEIEKFYDIGVTHLPMESHPVEAIINAGTQKAIQKQISTLPIIFDAMKTVVGNHYIPQPIIYKHKNGTNIGAISYNKVKWVDMKVDAKVKFLVS